MNIPLAKKATPALAPSEPVPRAIAIPGLEEVSPELAERLATDGRLNAALRRLEEEEDAIVTAMANAHQVRTAADAAEIDRLLGLRAPGVDLVSIDEMRKRRPEVARLIEVHRKAIEQNRSLIDQAKGEASQKVCAQVLPEYRRVVREMCEALLAFSEKQAAYDALVNALNAQDVSWGHLCPMTPVFVGARHDNQAPLRRYILEAVRAGFIPIDIVPLELRQRG